MQRLFLRARVALRYRSSWR